MIPIIPEKIKDSFCSAKWLMATMHFGMGENHSCYHPPIHRWNLEDVKRDPSMLHNTAHKIEQRRQMMNGEKPKECYYCFDMEAINPDVISDRKRFTNEHYAIERRQELIDAPYDKHVNPSYLELSFSNVCNFGFSYCSPGQSSNFIKLRVASGSPPVIRKYFKSLYASGNHFQNASMYGLSSSGSMSCILSLCTVGSSTG